MSSTIGNSINQTKIETAEQAPKPTHPRERLIQTAARLVHKQGWTATGINQILTEAGIPKGSFYYYFRSKEALGVAVIQRFAGEIRELIARTLLDDTLEPEAALEAFFQEVSHGKAAETFRYGCPMGNLASETATQCAPLLNETLHGLDLYRNAFRNLAERAQPRLAAEHSMAADSSSADLAEIAALLLQGAFLAFKCAPQTTHAIDAAHAAIRGLVFGFGSRSARARLELSASPDASPSALAS